MLRRIRTAKRSESAFTLIELLIVIVILGVLAAVVVFAVGGIKDKGTNAACRSDLATVTTAAEAYLAKNGEYADSMKTLVKVGLLRSEPSNENYEILYQRVGTGADQRVDISSTSCQGSSSEPPLDAEAMQKRYCEQLGNAFVEYPGLRFEALEIDEFSRTTRTFERMESVALKEIKGEWSVLVSTMQAMEAIVAKTGLSQTEIKQLSAGEIPAGFSQEQYDQLKKDLEAQTLSQKLERSGLQILDHASNVCGIRLF